jgi:hypothetical protein
MIRSHLVKKHSIRYDESYRFAGDYHLVARISKMFPLQNLDDNLIKYRLHGKQISVTKRLEQIEYADNVRKALLKQFSTKFSNKNVDLHLKLMKESYMDDDELGITEGWLNKLLAINFKKKLYNQIRLYSFFEKLLTAAAYNNALGAWAIEKKMLKFIKDHFDKGKSILEFGSGNGTEALLHSYPVTSIEHDSQYAQNRGVNHTCLLAPIENGWYRRDVVKSALERSYDLILVDGPTEPLRKGILDNLDLFVGNCAAIIFDDVHREGDRMILEKFCLTTGHSYHIIDGKKKSFAMCRKS